MNEEKEVEFKLGISDANKAHLVLSTMGFKHIDTCIEKDTYYVHPCRDFHKTDEALRLRTRKCGDSTNRVLTYKGPRIKNSAPLKTREEVEVEVGENQLDKVESILLKLGFKPLLKFTKIRKLYSNGNLEASIDTLLGVGYFLEVELKSRDKKELLEEVLNKILTSMEARIIDKTYLEICLETGKCEE